MEIQFHQQLKGKRSKFKGKNNSHNKFVGVRQRPSGRWVAEIKDTTQKIRMWLGTFETAEAAARAYDEAACLLRGSKTRTNFVTHVSANSPLASRIKNLLDGKRKTEEKQSKKQSIDDAATNITTGTSSASSSPASSGGDFSCAGKVNDDHTQLFDHSYKPDLSICNDDFDLGFSYRSNMSWGLGFAQEMLELPKDGSVIPEISSGEMEFSEFERMKVERQISASLYAMNGVQEYMDTVFDPNEAIWDLPSLCSLFC